MPGQVDKCPKGGAEEQIGGGLNEELGQRGEGAEAVVKVFN